MYTIKSSRQVSIRLPLSRQYSQWRLGFTTDSLITCPRVIILWHLWKWSKYLKHINKLHIRLKTSLIWQYPSNIPQLYSPLLVSLLSPTVVGPSILSREIYFQNLLYLLGCLFFFGLLDPGGRHDLALSFRVGSAIVIYSQHLGQLKVSLWTTVHCKQKLLWCRLKTGPVHENIYKYLGGAKCSLLPRPILPRHLTRFTV